MHNNFNQEDDEVSKKTRKSRVLEEIGTYYATPNAYADQFMAYLSSDEWKVVSYLCRYSFGYQKKEDHISISQFVHGAMKFDGSGYRDRGTGLCKSTVTKCLASLSKFGLARKEAENNTKTNKGALWSLELDYQKVDIQALGKRRMEKQQADRDRMKKPRASRKDNRTQ